MLERINGELIEFIAKTTGIDRETVRRVLKAEEVFFKLEVERALGANANKGGND